MSTTTRTILTTIAGIGLAAATVVPAGAAQSTQTLDCAGHELTIRVNDSNSSDSGGWSAVQVVEGGSGHLTPVRFSGVLTDTTAAVELGAFSSERGNGHVPKSKAVTACTTSFDATVADFVEDLETLPPGVALDDAASFTLTAYVIASR